VRETDEPWTCRKARWPGNHRACRCGRKIALCIAFPQCIVGEKNPMKVCRVDSLWQTCMKMRKCLTIGGIDSRRRRAARWSERTDGAQVHRPLAVFCASRQRKTSGTRRRGQGGRGRVNPMGPYVPTDVACSRNHAVAGWESETSRKSASF